MFSLKKTNAWENPPSAQKLTKSNWTLIRKTGVLNALGYIKAAYFRPNSMFLVNNNQRGLRYVGDLDRV
jgi:hypothetical protein